MAKANTNKKITHISPIGTARYPYLNEPDYGTDDYPIPEGKYKVALVMSREEAEEFVEKQLKPYLKEAEKLGKEGFAKLNPAAKKKFGAPSLKEPFTEIYDKETEEPTGEVEFRFNMKASGVSKKTGKEWTRRPGLFDAKGKPIDFTKVKVYGGSIVKVAFTVGAWFNNTNGEYGITCYLEAVQVLELRSGNSRSASSYGFGVEDEYDGVAEDDYGFGSDGEGGDEGGAVDSETDNDDF